MRSTEQMRAANRPEIRPLADAGVGLQYLMVMH